MKWIYFIPNIHCFKDKRFRIYLSRLAELHPMEGSLETPKRVGEGGGGAGGGTKATVNI